MIAKSGARLIAALVLLLAALPAEGQERKPGPLGPQAGPYREQEFLIPWERESGQVFLLHAKIFRPEGEQKQPLLLIAHGSPRGSENERARMHPGWADVQARWFAAQGFVVIVPMRRGYGRSDGPYDELSGPCDDPDYYNLALRTADDMEGMLRYMATQPYVDGSRMVVVGQSAGGLGGLGLISRNTEGVVAFINFAGGRGSPRVGLVCAREQLIDAVTRFGQTAKVPGLWLYTSNDKYFDPDLSQAMFAGFSAAGAPAEYKPMGSFGSDGHMLFLDPIGMSRWTPVVTEFLRAQKLMR